MRSLQVPRFVPEGEGTPVGAPGGAGADAPALHEEEQAVAPSLGSPQSQLGQAAHGSQNPVKPSSKLQNSPAPQERSCEQS